MTGVLIDVATADATETHGVAAKDTNKGTEDSEVGGGRLRRRVDTKPEQK